MSYKLRKGVERSLVQRNRPWRICWTLDRSAGSCFLSKVCMFPLQSCVKVFNHDYLENDYKEPWRFNKVDDQGGHRKDEGDSNLERQNLFWLCWLIISEQGKKRTRILPAMLWPDISSPAQSLAERRRSPLSCQSFFAWNRIWRTRVRPTDRLFYCATCLPFCPLPRSAIFSE